MERIIKLNNSSLLVKNLIKEYDEIIVNRLLMFEDSIIYENSIVIGEEKTVINLKGNEIIINKKLVHTDLYQLINNIISNLINDFNNLYIHSSLIKNNKNAIMILGDFNAGKTTISKYAKQIGYKIISADQSWLILNNELNVYKGSLYMSYDNTYEIIDQMSSNVKIDKILILQGINDGTLKCYENKDHYYNIKQITKYCTWSISNILMTEDIDLTLNKIVINDFVKRIEVPVVYANGKPCDIIKKMEEII